MRKIILTLMASLLSCSTVSAFWPEAVASSLEIGVFYRNDEIIRKSGGDCGCSDYSYSSSSNSGTDSAVGFPNARSTVKFRDLNIVGISASGKYVTCEDIYLRGYGDYGWITSGRLNRYESLGASNGYNDYSYGYDDYGCDRDRRHVRGHVYDFNIGVGYQFHWCDDSFGIAPVIGYSWHGQHLREHDNNSDYSYCDDYSSSSYYSYYDDCGYSSYNNNEARYSLRWNTPFVGVDLDYKFFCDWSLFGGYEFHWGTFHSRGRDRQFFGLVTDATASGLFNRKFHERSDDVYGHILHVGVKYDLCECWVLGVRGDFQWWEACRPHHRSKIFEADLGCHNKFVTNHHTRERSVEWYSAGVTVEVGMIF